MVDDRWSWAIDEDTHRALTAALLRAVYGPPSPSVPSPEHATIKLLRSHNQLHVRIAADWVAESLWRGGLVYARLAGANQQRFLDAVATGDDLRAVQIVIDGYDSYDFGTRLTEITGIRGINVTPQ